MSLPFLLEINYPLSVYLPQSSISYRILTASVWESEVNEIKIGQLAKVCFLSWD